MASNKYGVVETPGFASMWPEASKFRENGSSQRAIPVARSKTPERNML
jgi:hypothetical protein